MISDSAAPDNIYLTREVRGLNGLDRRYRDEVSRGQLIRLHRGAFIPKSDFEQESPQLQYQLKCLGAFYSHRGPVVLSHESAAAMHGIPSLGRYPKLIHILATMSAGTRTEHGYRKHGTWHPQLHVERRAELVMTDLLRTLVELAATRSFAAGVAALDWALREHDGDSPDPITRERLVDCADEIELRRGRRQFLRALAFADAGSESPGESLSRAVIHELGFPAPVLQQEFHDAHGLIGRTDFWWPDFNLVGEFDGVAKYVREEYSRGRSPAQIVMEEKTREDRIRATGPLMTRWGWSTVATPQLLFDKLRERGLPSARHSAYRSESTHPFRASSE